MSLGKNLLRIIGGLFAIIVTLGLAERAGAQARVTTYILYVSPTGSYNVPRDTGHPSTDALNNPNRPYDTIQHACQHSLPDDTIEVGAGTYTDSAYISNCSYLTVRPAAGATVILKGSSSNNYAVSKIDGSDHILFTGFEVDGTGTARNCSGISISARINGSVTTRSHDIQVKYCKVHDCGEAGIATNGTSAHIYGCDFINITGNEIYRCLSTGLDGGSGISLHNDEDITHTPGYHSTIQNNIVHDNVNQVRDLDSHGNIDLGYHTDGNGIIIDTTDSSSAKGPKILIQNNVVYRNGGRGIHVFLSSNVDVLNNTVYGNNLDPYLALGGELTAGTCDNVFFSNNVVQGNGLAPAFAVGLVSGQTNGTITFKNTTYTGCSALPPVGNSSRDRTNAAIDWPSTISHDPNWGSLFVNSSTGDFHLRTLATRSPLTSAQSQTALNRGSNVLGEYAWGDITGVSRKPSPPGGAVDRGAYEQ